MNKRVNNIKPQSIFEGASNWTQALEIYTQAYNNGTIEKIPIPGGQYDMPFCVLPSTTRHNSIGYLNTHRQLPQNTYIPTLDEIPNNAVLSKYFVVTPTNAATFIHQTGRLPTKIHTSSWATAHIRKMTF